LVLGKNLLCVHARSRDITTEVGASVAAVAVLALELGPCAGASHGVSDEHAEALGKVLVYSLSLSLSSRRSCRCQARGDTNRLEGSNLAWLSADVVDKHTTCGLRAEIIVELVPRRGIPS